MSDLITGHLLKEPADWQGLGALPKEIGCRVLEWAEAKLWFVETFCAGLPYLYRFGHPVGEPWVSDRVKDMVPAFAHASHLLSEYDYEGAEALGTLNVGFEIASCLKRRVFGFLSDTDTLELCSVCDSGRVERVRHVRHNLDLLWTGGRLSVVPLFWEDGDGDSEAEETAKALVDPDLLCALQRQPQVEILPARLADLMAHDLYCEELSMFLGPDNANCGVDPRELTDLQVVFERSVNG